MIICEKDKKGILLELQTRFLAIEKRQENLKEKIEVFKNDLQKSRLRED